MKHSRKLTVAQSRKLIILISITVMLCGLMFSRILLSVGMLVFVVTCLVHRNITEQLKAFISSPFLWSMSLLFVLPLISGLWSENISKWSEIIRIKTPLVLLPVCFAGFNTFGYQDWRRVALIFLTIAFAGTGWSLWQYFQDVDSVQVAYLKAHTIETPLGNDHVRFSLLISIAAFTSTFLLVTGKRQLQARMAIPLMVITFALVVYLHILAVRTGLICFYVGLVTFIFHLLRKKNKLRYAWLLLLFILFPVVSWFVFPTFKNRFHYLKYDLSFVKNDTYRSGSNDGNRLMSIKAGWQLLVNHPITGVGFGDIKNEMATVYEKKYGRMAESDKILPSSEWMMYGAGIGWPGFILFSLIMIVPFFVSAFKNNFAWWLLNIFMALSYLFDIGLEVQYGVFIHAFILLWWYKWLSVVPKNAQIEDLKQPLASKTPNLAEH